MVRSLQKEITYCSWDGEPAIIVEYAVRKVLDGYVFKDAEWVEDDAIVIGHEAAVIGQKDFEERWPGIGLPKRLRQLS
jgi:hypothetical protein